MTYIHFRKGQFLRKLIANLFFITALTTLGCSAQGNKPMFSPAPGSPIRVGEHPADLILADVNSDGKLDILTCNANSDDVTILLGSGAGQFVPSPGSPFKASDAPHLIATGDLNGDGHLDLALTSH